METLLLIILVVIGSIIVGVTIAKLMGIPMLPMPKLNYSEPEEDSNEDNRIPLCGMYTPPRNMLPPPPPKLDKPTYYRE